MFTRGMRWVQGYEVGIRWGQGGYEGYEVSTRGTSWV